MEQHWQGNRRSDDRQPLADYGKHSRHVPALDHRRNNFRDRERLVPNFKVRATTIYWFPQLLGCSFQKARNLTASSHQNAGFSIWVFKNFPGVIPPNPHSERGTTSRTQHPGVEAPQCWDPNLGPLQLLSRAGAPGCDHESFEQYRRASTYLGFLFLAAIISIGSPLRFGKAPNSLALKVLVGKWGQGRSKKFILGPFFLSFPSFLLLPFFLSFLSLRSGLHSSS